MEECWLYLSMLIWGKRPYAEYMTHTQTVQKVDKEAE